MADWQSIVKSVAPMIGTALGGPLGGMAISAIGNALGLSGATQDAVKQAIMGMSPEQSLALKQADIGFQEYMAKLGYDNQQALEQINAGDRASARQREISVKDWVPGILAMGVTLGFFGVLGWMLTFGKPAVGGDALLVMLGALGTAWGSIISYYFGSSAGSANKDQILGSKIK